jgi:hypothetical protein
MFCDEPQDTTRDGFAIDRNRNEEGSSENRLIGADVMDVGHRHAGRLSELSNGSLVSDIE